MRRNSETRYIGISAIELLGIVFIVLKLVGVINWSWGWVLAPIWIPAVLILFLIMLALVSKE